MATTTTNKTPIKPIKRDMVLISINVDPLNKDKEQYKLYQLDGNTVRVPIGKIVKVDRWVAEIALHCGDITDITEIEE